MHSVGKFISVPPRELKTSAASPLRVRETVPGEGRQSSSDSELVESVSKLSLLQPVLLLSVINKGYTVIFGHRRIAAAAACGAERVPAAVLPADSLDRREIIAIRAEELRFGEPLSELEKIIALDKLISFSQEQPGKIAGILSLCYGRELSTSYITRLRSLLELEQEALRALHEGKVSTGDLLSLSGHPILEAGEAVSLLAGRKLSRGKQKEAVRLMLYLADQGEKRWEKFLQGLEESGRPLLQSLRAACAPSMERDMARVRTIIDEINLPDSAAITPPDNMEGDGYRLTVKIRDEERFSDIIRKLREKLDEGIFRTLLNILDGRE